MTARSIDISWDTHRSTARGQGVLLTVAGLALIPAVTATVLRVVPPTDDATALIAAFIPYGLLAYLVASGLPGRRLGPGSPPGRAALDHRVWCWS